jgi:hypothetical protein
MRMLVWVFMPLLLGVLLLGSGGCASSHYSEESYNRPGVLQEYIRNHPEYYQEWRNEMP